MRLGRWWLGIVFINLLHGQAPVVEARGVVNGVTFELAPSTVAPGGIFSVFGLNLAPGLVAASAIPLPVSLGSPPVEVTVNGRSAPLYFVSPAQINAQAPWETEAGQAQVVVKRGGVASRAATLIVQAVVPSLFSLNGLGFGPAIAVRAANGRLVGRGNPPVPGDVLTLYASGLGPVDPAVASGAAGPSGPLAQVSRNQRAYVNGFAGRVLFAGLAPGFVGLFQINLQLPEQAAEGDVLEYFSGQQMANRVTLGSPASPRVRLLTLPAGAGNVVGIVDTDLSGSFAAINGPRGADGCFQNVFLLDFRRNQTTPVSECLVSSGPNAQTPFVSEGETARLAALVGPPVGAPPAGISSKVLIVDGATGRRLTVDLPAPASNLVGGGPPGGRGLVATLPGDPPRAAVINTDTGEVQVAPGGLGAAGAGGAPNINVDGLSQVVSTPVRLSGNRTAVVLADSETNPQRAVFVVVSQSGEVATKIAFPSGYLPLIPPRAQQPAGGGGGGGGAGGAPPGGGPGAPGQAPGNAPRESAVNDPQGSRIIAVARSTDGAKHALAIFDVDAGAGRAMDFPAGVFAASCAPDLRLFNLALGRKIVLPISDRLETAATNPCASTGLLSFDLASSLLGRILLPGNGTMDVNSLRMLNDYLFGTNADRVSQQNSSSVFVYDPTNDGIRKLDTPRGATAFTGLQPIAATGQLLAVATNRAAGDEGLILFDLGSGSARLFPVPDGFTRVANPRLLLANRKLTARGLKSDGSQLLIFDPATGAVTVVPNPEGVQALGAAVAAAAGGGAPGGAGGAGGAPGQARIIWELNENSNSVLAGAFAGDRAVGLVVIEGI